MLGAPCLSPGCSTRRLWACPLEKDSKESCGFHSEQGGAAPGTEVPEGRGHLVGRTPAAGSSVGGRAAFRTVLPASEGWLAVRGTSEGDGPSLWCVHAHVLRRVQVSATAWPVARQAPLSIGFPRYEYWNGCHFLLQGIFPTQESNPCLVPWQAGSLHRSAHLVSSVLPPTSFQRGGAKDSISLNLQTFIRIHRLFM